MTIAICLRCGADKVGALTSCPDCGLEPETQREQAYSLAISDHYFSRQVLREIGADIAKDGRIPTLPTDQEQKFLAAVERDPNSALFRSLAAENNRAVELRHEVGEVFDRLTTIPIVIFQLVAGADGKVEKKEKEAFADLLRPARSKTLFKSALMKALTQFCEKDAKRVTVPTKQHLLLSLYAENISLISKSVAIKHLRGFRDDVRTLAFAIAGISGGFWGLTNRVSRKEKHIIDGILAELETFEFSERIMKAADNQSVIARAMQRCVTDIEGLFERHKIQFERLEVLGFVAAVLDFEFQMTTSDSIYRRELNAHLTFLSKTYKVSRNDIAACTRTVIA